MKCNAIKFMLVIVMGALLGITGCGGSGSETNFNNHITRVGYIYHNTAPDLTNGPTCLLSVKMYYDESIATADIESLGVIAPNGWQWIIPASDGQLGTSDGKPYIGGTIYYGDNPHMMPLAGTWVFRLTLKNGQVASMQKSLHEPGSTADATHQYVYTAEDMPLMPNTPQYIAALGRFPDQGYTLEYSEASGGSIVSTGLATTRGGFLATEPCAYNMVCWLYDANKTYLGFTITEFSPLNHARSTLITTNGELLITPEWTAASTGQVDLSKVKYLRFVYFDGAQYEPSSYSQMDYRSISSLVAVQGSGGLNAITSSPARAAIFNQVTASDIYKANFSSSFFGGE